MVRFKRARLERKDRHVELWLGTEKERYPLVTFPTEEGGAKWATSTFRTS